MGAMKRNPLADSFPLTHDPVPGDPAGALSLRDQHRAAGVAGGPEQARGPQTGGAC